MGIRRVNSRMPTQQWCCWVLQGEEGAGLSAHTHYESGGYGGIGGELLEGMWFELNVVELGPGVADANADRLSGVEGSSSYATFVLEEEVALDESCMEGKLSGVGMWTWAACLKKEVQNLCRGG